MRRRTLELQKLYLRDLDTVKSELSKFSSEEALWKDYDGINNCAGNLILHICGNLQHFIGAVIGDSGFERQRDLEFSRKNVSVDELTLLIETTYKSVEIAFDKLDDEVLDDSYPAHFRYETISYFEMLTHLYGHLNYHLGQVNYYRRLH